MNIFKRMLNFIRKGRNIHICGDYNSIEVDQQITSNEKITIGDLEIQVKDLTVNITVKGDVNGDINTMSGDVIIYGNVSGGVDTMSGDVKAKEIRGSVDTMSGDITVHK